MYVLENHKHWIRLRQRLDLLAQCFEGFLPAQLRRQFERGIASVVWQRKHFGKERSVLAWCGSLRQQCIEFVQLPVPVGVFVCKARGALHLADDRVERTVRMLW